MLPDNRDDLVDIVTDLSETVLDQFIEDPLIRDIPLIGTAVSLAKIGKTISDRIFLAKVKKFLLSVSVNTTEKEEFIRKLESNKKLKQETQESVILLVNRSDSFEKVGMSGKIFDSFVKDQITIVQFRKLCFAVDLAFVDDLKLFIQTDDRQCYGSLVRTGFTRISSGSFIFSNEFAQSSIEITELGQLFLNIMRG